VPQPDESETRRLPQATFCHIGPGHADAVRRFFASLALDTEAMVTFHPHPFTREHALTIAHYDGRDYYAGMLVGDEMVAYGMLRGWDEGYEIPSLGIAVSASHRGLGLGRGMMEHLHAVARDRGATTIRLKLYKTNTVAARLYRRMGYVLSDHNEREWLGILDLHAAG
jgi:ribosomal protein S18 acetylase RimI-like enzyme